MNPLRVSRFPSAVTIGPVKSVASASLLLALAVSGCANREEPEAYVPVKVQALAPEQITVSSRFSGSVESLQTTTLAFKLAGTVEKLFRPDGGKRDVQVGDTLSKGTVIAALEEGDLRRTKASAEAKVAQLEARVVTARNNLEIAVRNFERFRNSAGSVSKVARDDADAKRVTAAGEFASAEHALADARIQLDQATDDYLNRELVIPFDEATVAEKLIEPGERVQRYAPAFKLIDVSTVHVRFGVPEGFVGEPAFSDSADKRILLGQKLRVVSNAFEGRSIDAIVTKIAPQADPKTRTFLTELTVSNARREGGNRLLRPGMIVTVLIGAQRDRDVILIPMAAIHQGGTPDERIVYEAAVENGRHVARARRVALGGVFDNMIEILPAASEVKTGANIVMTTAERLTDGSLIRVVPDTDASAALVWEAK